MLAATEVRGGHLVTRAEKGSRLWWVREWQVMEGREDVLTRGKKFPKSLFGDFVH